MQTGTIIGAGPAGLTAAYEASKLGWRPTVLESDEQVGGLSRTVNYRGYRFDIGGHRFFSKVPLINELWREILGEDMLLRPRLSRILYRSHFFDYPLKAGNALLGLGPVEALLIGLSYAKSQVLPSKEESTFEQWVSNRFGHRLYRIFFKTYTEKVWGIPCNEISADWAAQRIKNLSLIGALKNALLGTSKKDGQVITTLIDQFRYPKYGPGMMWERCEQLLTDDGFDVLRGVRVERIQHRNGRVECVHCRRRSGETLEFGGDHFLSTMPLRELINSLDPAPPAEVLRAANKLRYRDYLTVALIVNREEVFPDNWIYIHSPEVMLGRIQNYKNWSPHMVPDQSRTSLGLEYFLWDKEDQWKWSNDQLIDLGVRECARLGIIEPDEVEDGTVIRMKKAYPVYDRDFQQSLATVRRYLAGITNLQMIGRNGQHRYNNQDHSMLTGVYAARNIAGADYDIWSVNVEQEYHEEVRAAGKSAAKRPAATPAAAGDRAVPTRVEPAPAVSAKSELSPEALIEAAFAQLHPAALGLATGMVCGIGLFLATVFLLLKGGPIVGPNLSLFGHYFLGFEASWGGAFIGLFEAGIGGFIVGYAGAQFRNWGMLAYARLIKRAADIQARREFLDRV